MPTSTDHDDGKVVADGLAGSSQLAVSAIPVPLTADSVAAPRLVYGGLELDCGNGTDQPYPAIYFVVDGSCGLGRVTFEGLDAIRGSRGEHLPFSDDVVRFEYRDWVFVVKGSAWLRERHDYEMRHYATPLLDTHRHYLFVFHDVFIEAVAEGIWFDIADGTRPFALPASHPLLEFDTDLPCERFTSVDGLDWEVRRSPRSDDDLVADSRYCSQRVYQFNLVLDGSNREAASIWIRTVEDVLVSRITRSWVGEFGRMEGFGRPNDFSNEWEAYLREVAQRRREMGKMDRAAG